MHETSVRLVLQRRRSRGDAFSTEAARAGQAAHSRRQHAAVAGAPLRPAPGSNKYQVYFRAPAGDGEPWKRVLRRAHSEDEARRIFAQAEAALDTEQATPVGADVRASRTIRMLGEEYLKDSSERGKQPRTMEGRESRAQRAHPADHRRRAGDEVARRAQPQGDGEGQQDALLPARPRGPARPAGRDAQAGLAAGLARPQHRSRSTAWRSAGQRPARSDERSTSTRACALRPVR